MKSPSTPYLGGQNSQREPLASPVKCFTDSASWRETSDRPQTKTSLKIGQSGSVVPFTAQESSNSPELSANPPKARQCSSSAPVQSTKDEAALALISELQQAAVDANSILLVEYGIKVRDFGYESTLPPVPSVFFVPQQIIGGARPLKRSRPYDDEDDNAGRETRRKSPRLSLTYEEGYYLADSQSMNPLEREEVEPSGSLSISHLPRQLIASNSHRYGSSRHINVGTLPPTTPQRRTRLPRLQSANISFASPAQAQNDEVWIDTPLVTPNGSIKSVAPENADEHASPEQGTRHSPKSPLACRADTPTRRSPFSTPTPPRTSPPNSERLTSSPEGPTTPRKHPKPTYHLRKVVDNTPPREQSTSRRKTRSLSSSPKGPKTKQAMKVKVKRRISQSVPPRRSARIAQRSRERTAS
ncbi:hypothetical protein QCA50_020133 [Cerrena zonata]|uniref:Uncharacterized protein n=1 Tax=Cerrena zonata TaxID=2478898 RepID=A0AAW0FCT3_9APHY